MILRLAAPEGSVQPPAESALVLVTGLVPLSPAGWDRPRSGDPVTATDHRELGCGLVHACLPVVFRKGVLPLIPRPLGLDPC